jgi:hypothetical protein
MGSSRHLFSVKLLLDFVPIMAYGIVHVQDQLFAAELPLGFHLFVWSLWCDKCQEIDLIDFASRRKDFEDQKFRESDKYTRHGPICRNCWFRPFSYFLV